MSTALTMDDPNLVFANSESKSVGLSGNLKRLISDNAPRIVGTMKLAGDIAIGLSMNPWLIGYTAFAGLGRIMLMIYGTKKNQQKVAAEHEQKEQRTDDHHKAGVLEKVLHPREYPVESSSGLSTIAEMFGMGFGVSRFLEGATGFTQVILGAVAVASYANILLGKEKKNAAALGDEKSESVIFGKSESRAVGFVGRVRQIMKNNPVLLSSLMLFTLNVGLVVGGVLEGYGAAYITGASILLAANLIQTLFVRKKKYNIEGAQEERQHAAAIEPRAESFKEHIEEKRKDEPGAQLA